MTRNKKTFISFISSFHPLSVILSNNRQDQIVSCEIEFNSRNIIADKPRRAYLRIIGFQVFRNFFLRWQAACRHIRRKCKCAITLVTIGRHGWLMNYWLSYDDGVTKQTACMLRMTATAQRRVVGSRRS